MKKIIFFLMVIIVSQIVFVSASTAQLLCLNRGQVIQFSQCNPNIEDRTCDSVSGCQFCVTISSNGAYCPANMNNCNSINVACTTLQTSTTTNNTQTNPPLPSINQTQNNTNTNTNNNQNTNQNNNQNTNTNTNTNSNINDNQNTNTNTNTNSNINSNINSNNNQNINVNNQDVNSSINNNQNVQSNSSDNIIKLTNKSSKTAGNVVANVFTSQTSKVLIGIIGFIIISALAYLMIKKNNRFHY